MRTTCLLLLLIFLTTLVVSTHSQVAGHKLATVTLVATNSFGKSREGCSISKFMRLDFDNKQDYANSFVGLSGKNIPFGYKYEAAMRCDDDETRGPFFLSVGRQNKFELLAAWLNVGDYETGVVPRLTVSISANSETQSSNKAWIKLVGVYVGQSEVDKIDPQTHSAEFYEIVPGRYLLLLLNSEKLVCTKQIDFLEAHARLDLSVSREGCKAEKASFVKLVE